MGIGGKGEMREGKGHRKGRAVEGELKGEGACAANENIVPPTPWS